MRSPGVEAACSHEAQLPRRVTHGAQDPENERVQPLRPAVRPLGRLEAIRGDAVVPNGAIEASNLDMRRDKADKANRERRVDKVISRRPEGAAARPKKALRAPTIAFGFTPSMSGAVRLVSIRHVIVREQQLPRFVIVCQQQFPRH